MYFTDEKDYIMRMIKEFPVIQTESSYNITCHSKHIIFLTIFLFTSILDMHLFFVFTIFPVDLLLLPASG